LCNFAKQLLCDLDKKRKQIPASAPLAAPNHPLAVFSGNPMAACTHRASELEDWEDILNPMMKRAFDWGANSGSFRLNGLARRGTNGLDGFYRFIEYFITHRGLKGGLVEVKFGILMAAIDSECVHNKILSHSRTLDSQEV
jgi:hypothetical protein